MTPLLISIIICTRNRASFLSDTLAGLRLAMRHYGAPAEAVVIDNGSTDNTREVVEAFISEHPDCPLRYVLESTPGLSHARNTGVAQSGGDVLCFLDDDVFVPAIWLTCLLPALALDAKVGCIAGQIRLHWPVETAPKWIDGKYHGFYGRYSQGEATRMLSTGEGFFGANFALTRTAWEAVGPFDTRLGRCGSNLLSGEDTDYARRIWEAGFTIAYSAEGYVNHRVTPDRLQFNWLLRRYFWQGVTTYYYPQNAYPGYALRWLPKLLSNMLFLPFSLFTANRRVIYRTCFRIANAGGPLYGWYLHRRCKR